ncbi:MAG: NAD(P)/FAD-dependent oxidoreductase [Chitinophagaceae bacterium]|nr:NAD(P)/FAD-dependent oxidoreductase [Chitinophagaceae bacterium]
MNKKRFIVIGGGAAGFFCAVNAARMRPELEVIVAEKTNKILSKVRVSGGGRCNVTHSCFSIAEMVKKYPRGSHFLKKTFYRFFTTDTIRWFEERGVALKTEPDGRMFPETDSSETIIECMLADAHKYRVQIQMNREVKELTPKGEKWLVQYIDGQEEADYICIACGGYPKASLFEWILRLGHTIEDPLPSLFTFNIPKHPVTELMGVAVEKARVRVSASKLEEEAPLLITHWGMSGPAILKLSAWGARELAEKGKPGPVYHFSTLVNWVPPFNDTTLRAFLQKLRFEAATQKMVNRNPFRLPQRLWEFILNQSDVNPDLRWADLPARQQNLLIKNLCAHEFQVKGKTTFKEEFVTAGGIRLGEVDPSTMMSRLHRHLYFAGEILDVDGITGGFNFQHAWTSGWIVAESIAEAD